MEKLHLSVDKHFVDIFVTDLLVLIWTETTLLYWIMLLKNSIILIWVSINLEEHVKII